MDIKGYGIGFDAPSQFSLPNGERSKNVAVLGFNNLSSEHAYNRKKKKMLVLGEWKGKKISIVFKQFLNFWKILHSITWKHNVNKNTYIYIYMFSKYLQEKTTTCDN